VRGGPSGFPGADLSQSLTVAKRSC